jgi:hypothetical protein
MASRTKKSQSQIADEIREKANKAEAEAGKTRKADTVKADTVKADAAVAEAPAPKPPKASKVAAVKSNDDQDRALFLQALPKIGQLRAALNTANANLRNAYKQAKADGFAKKDFDEAFLMQGAEGEKVKKATISRSLRIARWLGMDLGAQLDMFEQDARVPAIDRAYEEGKSQAMQGISLKCDYAQETEQYRTFAPAGTTARRSSPRVLRSCTPRSPPTRRPRSSRRPSARPRRPRTPRCSMRRPPASP